MEPFLPSEVARLVYGYLNEVKCNEAARSFLEHSPHLSECLAVNKEGKGFNTRPAGCSLTDILDEYCEIRSMVAEKLQKLPGNSAEKLRHYGNLIGQLRYLIDATQSGQTLLVSITLPPQGSSVQGNSRDVTSVTSTRNRVRILGSSDRVKHTAGYLGQDTKQQSSKDAGDRSLSVCNSVSPLEATPLENLPGISGITDNQSTQTTQENRNAQNVSESGQTAECEHISCDDSCSRTPHEASPSKPSTSSANQCKKCCEKCRTSKYQQLSPCTRTSPAVSSHNSSPVEDGSSCFSSPKQRYICSSKRKSANPMPVKVIHTPMKSHTPCKVRRSHSDDNESSESLNFSVLTRALLDNKELHKKIAENINKVICKPGPGETSESVESHPSTSAAAEPSRTETSPVVAGFSSAVSPCDGMLQELNQAIKTIVDQTEQDPVFERFLDEIIGPLDEDMTPSPVEMQSEGDEAVPDLVVTTKQTRNIDIGCEDSTNIPNRKLSSVATGCSKEQQHFQEGQKQEEGNSGKLNSDIPLKQRLRSARQRKSDASSDGASVSPTILSGKEKKKEGTSLEDQNAAAIQCIVDAKISSQKTSEVSHIDHPQKNGCTSMSTSTVDTRTFNTASSIDNSQEKPGDSSSQLMVDSSDIVTSLQKETNQTSDTSDRNVSVGSSDATKVVNDGIHNGDVILFDGNLTFMDNNTSLPLSTETSSNFVLNPSPPKSHLNAPLVITSQPSVSTDTSQVMTITIPGATDALHQAATLSGIHLHPPLEQAVPHSLTTSSTGQVVTLAIPGSQNVNSAVNEQDLMSMSTVIMCGSDGMIPQFISLSHQDHLRGNLLLPGSGGSHYVPIVPRETPVTTGTTVYKTNLVGAAKPQQIDVCQPVVMCPIPTVMNSGPSPSKTFINPKLGTSKQAKPSTSRRKKNISSDERKGVRDRVGVRTRSQVKPSAAVGITLYADDSKNDAEVMCSNAGQQHSASCGLSLPSIILESPRVKVASAPVQEGGVTPSQDAGREKLLGALNLKEACESSLKPEPTSDELDIEIKSKGKMESDGNKMIKSKSELMLQNVDKYPRSPQLMTLVNLSKNVANSGHSPSGHMGPGITSETTGNKCSENKLTQIPRETPQATTSQGRIDMNSKRMSLSTPRRQRHVRALDFTTPPKAGTIPKVLQPKGHSPKTSEKLPKTLRRTSGGVSKVRSTLFKTSQNKSESIISDVPLLTTGPALASTCSDNGRSNIPPIATRSPLPQLSGGWDNAAGVGQIICDDINMTRGEARFCDVIVSSLSVTETEDEINLAEKQSGVTDRSINLQNKGTGHKMTPKFAKGNLLNNKIVSYAKKSWDADLRALVNIDYEGSQVLTNDSGFASKKTTKKKEVTKSRRKSSQVTEEEVRRLEEHLNEVENMDNGSINADQKSTNQVSENMTSSSDISVVISTHDSEVNETCVPGDKLNEKRDSDQLDNQGAGDKVEAVEEADGKEQVTRVHRRDNMAVETADSNEVNLSKSSDSSTMETVNPSVSGGSAFTMASSSRVTQSPTKLKAAERRIVHHNSHMHQSPNFVNTEENSETFMIHTDDNVNNDTNSFAELKGITSSGENITDGQHVPLSQSKEFVSSESVFYPSESQNKDFQTYQCYKSSSSKEQSFANLPGNPPLKKSRTQKQVCDMMNRSEPQPKSVTTPVLDTPRKTDAPSTSCWGTEFMSIPLTPRVMSPHPDDTPVTKLVNGNSCIDFSLIQTPSFPPTPNIAVTPESCHESQGTPSSYATRSTDYSSCSPYYKPSDKLDSSTSDKPLEQLLIEECSKLENNTIVQASHADDESHKEDTAHTDNGQCQPLSVTDKTLGEVTPLLSDCVTDIQTKEHVEKGLVSDEADGGQVVLVVGASTREPSPEKPKQTKEMTKKIGVRDCGNNAKSKNISTKRRVRSHMRTYNKSSDMKDNPSETYTSTKRRVRSVSRTANKRESLGAQTSASFSTKKTAKVDNKRSGFKDEPSETHSPALISTERNAKSILRAAYESSDLENEPSEYIANLCKGLNERTKDEIIQRHLEAARVKIFGCNSPSDDSDFESSIDFGQNETETKTVLSDAGYNELTKSKESAVGQKERETITHSSKFYSMYSDDSNVSVQHVVEPQRQTDEARPISGLSLMKKKFPTVPSLSCEAQIRKMYTDENVNCKTSSCQSEVPECEIFSQHYQTADNFRKSSLLFRSDDSLGTGSHTSPSAKAMTLRNELDEKKRRMVAKLKGLDASNMPNSEQEQSGIIFTVKTVASGLEPSGDKDVDARKQLREKEDNLAKTGSPIPTKVIKRNGGEITPAKKNLHLSVEAIADRLTREKIAVQAPPMTQTPVRRSLTCEDSSSEDFPALHLSSDDDTQSEYISLSQVESQMAKLHGVEGATADILTVRSTPRAAHDVYRDLQLTPKEFQRRESDPVLLDSGYVYENERQEQSNTSKCGGGGGGVLHTSVCTVDYRTPTKKLSPTRRQENMNKKIRTLLGDDVSPIKNLTEVREVCKDVNHGLFDKLSTATKKHNSPLKNTLEIESQDKKLREKSGISNVVKKVQENEVSSKKNETLESNKMKKMDGSYETSNTEMGDAMKCSAAALTHGVEGLSSLNTSMMYEQRQVSDNETYIGIVYADEGPKGNNLVFEDISNFSLTFELDDLDGVVKTYKCTISEFRELFCASPKQYTRESNSCESDQFVLKRKSTSSNCKKDKNLDCVKSSKAKHKELFHRNRNVGPYSRGHRTRSPSPNRRKSTHFSHDRRRMSHVHRRSPSPVHRRWALSSNHGRRSRSLDRRSSSSLSPVSSTSKMSTFSPLDRLYSEYLKAERKCVRPASHCRKRNQDFCFRSNERLSLGQGGRGKAKYHDRHIHSQRVFVHSSCRKSSHTLASSHGVSDSHGRILDPVKEHGPSTDKRSTQEVKATETYTRKVSDDTALLAGTVSGAEDVGKEPATIDTQIKNVTEGRQNFQDTDEPLEEGELVDDDSMPALNEYKCNNKPAVWLQQYPSPAASVGELRQHTLVGSDQAENASEDTPPDLKGSTSTNSMAAGQLLEQSRLVKDKPSQELEKVQKKSFQKEASFAEPSSGRALPPKKRKASSEELSVQVEKRIRTDGPQALLKKVDLDHLLDFVHGEKPG